MGCAQSKIENEEAVTRCKERRDYMKKAVTSRNEFSAAHSGYTMALKHVGGALSDYGQGEVQVQDFHQTIHHHAANANNLSQPTTQPPYDNLPPPPPPLPNFSPAPPLKRASTMPEFTIPKPDFKQSDPIQEHGEDEDQDEDDEEDEDEEDEHNARHDLVHRRNRTIGGGGGRKEAAAAVAASRRGAGTSQGNEPVPPPPPESKDTTWDYFFPMVENMPGHSLSETDEIRPSDNDESDGGGYNNVNFKRAENGGGGARGGNNGGVQNMGGGVGSQSHNGNVDVEEPQTPRTPERVIETEAAGNFGMKQKQMVHANTAPQETRRGVKVLSSVNLLHILIDLDDHFLKASESAQNVSKMLEATRMHYHSNFADNRGHIDHSARVMRVITWNRSFRGMPNAGDGKDDFDLDEHETHATVLDKLLAWEKKLYDEVKAGELMKIEYQRKVALLNKQKKRGANTESLEKTKAAVSHLHTRYIVDMQSMDSTVSEINRLRDAQLYPKLVALVDGMTQMWDAMHVHHDSQLKIVADLRSLDVSHAPKETSEEHYGRTTQLLEHVQVWHTHFQKLVNHQKEHIQNLNSWLKLNLIPIESSLKEKVSSPPRVLNPPIHSLLYAWHEHLDKLPAELAGNAIFSFAGIIRTITLHQEEEAKLKEKCEATRKEYARKVRSFEDWCRKHMPTPDEVDPDRTGDANHRDPLADKQFEVESVKKRLEEEVEAHQKHCKQVREKSLSSLKTHLPELFRAMSDFSLACSDMYKRLQSISQPHDPTSSLS